MPRSDGGFPDDEDDIRVRRARLEPGLGGEGEDEDPELATDGGVDREDAGRERSAGKECPHCDDGVRHPDDGACLDCQRRFAEEAGVDG